MRLLAFDTSTERLSIAAVGPDGVVHGHAGAGGAQASAQLLPAIRAVLAQAGLALHELDAIAFGRGPGSFTGLRTACAVAQGLAWGAGRLVLPIDTLLAVAEDARLRHGTTRVVAALDARMDEVYTARYAWDDAAWRTEGPFALLAPEAVAAPAGYTLAGTARAAYGDRLAPGAPGVPALPTADAMLRLAPALLAAGGAVRAQDALPLYLRDKVAETTAERLAKK
ncbi:tRNA (adenosine(37)-N6)-threonylcarbamoyltransferase complex dimerization subunit type 1 TsaB [Xylophilus sp.]|uniref:tRNA (adenosine(37)-N6)-threonylcarbamoyltransferase complex dimerization subunit type 1 TsaB n=1 Tax=Xylophilus sp. TaxID=2653893 RepID=UPI002D7F3D2A|nr:tRNA (adenosine(37)-N6)-threonylcarbamoyltransferase complex dimerization subunit type 1 TsaB [Xylophilus sp.]